jgi:hypothetical protein
VRHKGTWPLNGPISKIDREKVEKGMTGQLEVQMGSGGNRGCWKCGGGGSERRMLLQKHLLLRGSRCPLNRASLTDPQITISLRFPTFRTPHIYCNSVIELDTQQ